MSTTNVECEYVFLNIPLKQTTCGHYVGKNENFSILMFYNDDVTTNNWVLLVRIGRWFELGAFTEVGNSPESALKQMETKLQKLRKHLTDLLGKEYNEQIA